MAESAPVPNFAELLAPYLGQIPQPLIPRFLSELERRAAQRYRDWAEAAGDPDEAAGLIACSRREDEIAERAGRLFPAEGEDPSKIDGALSGAAETYLGVFRDLPVREQYRIQANAERQGAAAWRGLATQVSDAAQRAELEAIARLEEESASWLEALLARG
jgi:hypothetical protein